MNSVLICIFQKDKRNWDNLQSLHDLSVLSVHGHSLSEVYHGEFPKIYHHNIIHKLTHTWFLNSTSVNFQSQISDYKTLISNLEIEETVMFSKIK